MRLEAHTSYRKGGQAKKKKNNKKRQNAATVKKHSLQMLKPNSNGCKNGKQFSLPVQYARSAVQNPK